MALKIWVGKRESDILTYKYYDVSITFWGSNTKNNHSFCTSERLKDNYGKDFTSYVLKLLRVYISQDNKIEIHFYNNSFAYKLLSIDPSLKNHIVNINSQRIFDITRHKTLSRLWLQNSVDVPKFSYLSKHECQYNKLLNLFPGYDRFIIQKSISGGGNGTYLVSVEDCENIVSSLDEDDIFLVSPYYENNISLSCHLIIDENGAVVFPISEQLLRYENNKISYCGNKYLKNADRLSIDTKKVATVVGNSLRTINYRGICGLDFIFSHDRLFLIEINPRYQGSSYLINAELNRMKLPSLFELNEKAFNDCIDKNISKQIEKMDISLESHTCIYKGWIPDGTVNHPKKVHLFLDGLSNAHKFEDDVYLYRYLKEIY